MTKLNVNYLIKFIIFVMMISMQRYIQTAEIAKKRVVVIFVHGTRPTELVPSVMERFITRIEEVLCVEKEKIGLISYKDLENREYLTELAAVYCKSKDSSTDDFYFYSWSGKLNPQERKNAGIQFAGAISKLIKEYEKKDGEKPIIEIISHSHGGNVALLMGEHLYAIDSACVVDTLILLGCPIQKITKYLVTLPVFKKVYNIHSHNDWLQILDPQGIHPLMHEKISKEFFGTFHDNFHLFSERHFCSTHRHIIDVNVRWSKNKKPQDPKKHLFPKWLQKRINITNKVAPERGLLHIEFTLLTFINTLAQLIVDIDCICAKASAEVKISADKDKNQDITIIL